MRTETPQPVRLADYVPFPFAIDTVDLHFVLDPKATHVTAHLRVRRTGDADAPLVLNGENLDLVGLTLDGKALDKNDYVLSPTILTIPATPDSFDLVIETRFSPEDNKALSGLYMSAGRYCTQCEAEGFRHITYYPDRPDVLSRFSTRIEAPKEGFPTLLSNGNLLESGDLSGGRHFARWQDPFPKPAYLFALVAGAFDMIEDSFTTMSGRLIPLRIYVDPGDAPRAVYAMDALKRAMKWDEEVFGREYDLDLFMIVAVRDFNFGAMENKGLNVFNSSVLLADPDTATDLNYETIESVVAHEYFHNWTGNRITCRDWFQLCLKEGLTVYRDQEFSADQRGAAICRIKDVQRLRTRQFPEDAGPLAHPVRPAQYLKIDNFYTATIYEKGAELIRMLKALIGDQAFADGMDLYFKTLDGTAATMEQFLDCFAKAAKKDLSDFLHWYEQAGTPHVYVTENWDEQAGALTLTLRQKTEPTNGQPDKRPLPMPVRTGLLGQDGPMPMTLAGETSAGPLERTLVLEKEEQSWTFTGLPSRPLVSLLRGFSAPVTLVHDQARPDLEGIITRDPDMFRRWESAQSYGLAVLTDMVAQARAQEPLEVDPAFLDAMGALISDDNIDPAFAALAITPPSEMDLFLHFDAVDPGLNHTAREALLTAMATRHTDALIAARARVRSSAPFAPDAISAGRRALDNACLSLLARLGPETGGNYARQAFDNADNMTSTIGALAALEKSGSPYYETALAQFFTRWQDNPLVLDKWFAMQAAATHGDVFARIESLLAHPSYRHDNPNRVRALLATLSTNNPSVFHDAQGRGYALLAREILRTDKINPALAARLLGAFESWRTLEPGRQKLARQTIKQILDTKGLSQNTYEIASRQLA